MTLFFTKIKTSILSALKKAAQEAVIEAEKVFGSGQGELKKQAAISFVVNSLPLPGVLKSVAAALLGSLIDTAIETAVQMLKSNVIEQ